MRPLLLVLLCSWSRASSTARDDVVEPPGCALGALAPRASLGQLSTAQRRCLEDALAESRDPAERHAVSVLLMNDAWARGDLDTWVPLVTRHLAEIGPEDPEALYRYAVYLSKKEPTRAPDALRFADLALDQRAHWTGDTARLRVRALTKIRAVASRDAWSAAEQAYAAAPTAEARGQADGWRDTTRACAHAWALALVADGKDPTDAVALCVTAGGTDAGCRAAP